MEMYTVVDRIIGSQTSIFIGLIMSWVVLNAESERNSAREKYRLLPHFSLNLDACCFKRTGPKVSIYN